MWSTFQQHYFCHKLLAQLMKSVNSIHTTHIVRHIYSLQQHKNIFQTKIWYHFSHQFEMSTKINLLFRWQLATHFEFCYHCIQCKITTFHSNKCLCIELGRRRTKDSQLEWHTELSTKSVSLTIFVCKYQAKRLSTASSPNCKLWVC